MRREGSWLIWERTWSGVAPQGGWVPRRHIPPACRNSFNVYRGYVRLYGARAPLRLAEHIGGLERQHADRLALLPERLRHTFLRRRDAAAKHEDALRWVIPQPSLDEAAYRREDAS